MSVINSDYYHNGQKKYEQYTNGTDLHREDGPQYTSWHDNGNKSSEEYRIKSILHRLDGPALINWDYNGVCIYKIYCINGLEIESSSDEEFKKIVKLMVFK